MNAGLNNTGSMTSSSGNASSRNTTVSDLTLSDGSDSVTSYDPSLSVDTCLDYIEGTGNAQSMILVKQKSLKKNASDMQSSSSVDDVTSCCSKSSSDHNASSSRWGKVQTNILDRRNARVVSRGNQVAPAPETQHVVSRTSCSDDCSASSSSMSSSSVTTASPFVLQPRGRERYRMRRKSTKSKHAEEEEEEEEEEEKKEEKEEEQTVLDKLQTSLNQLDRFVNVSLKDEMFLARGDQMPRHFKRNKKLADRYETLKQVMAFQELLVRIRHARETKHQQNNPKSGKALDPIGEEPEDQKGSQPTNNDRLSPDGESSPDNECESESVRGKGKALISAANTSTPKNKSTVSRNAITKQQNVVANKYKPQTKNNTIPNCVDAPELDAVLRENVDLVVYKHKQNGGKNSLKGGEEMDVDSGNEDGFSGKSSGRSGSKSLGYTPGSVDSNPQPSRKIANQNPDGSRESQRLQSGTQKHSVEGRGNKSSRVVQTVTAQIENTSRYEHGEGSGFTKDPSSSHKGKPVCHSPRSDLQTNKESSFFRSRLTSPKDSVIIVTSKKDINSKDMSNERNRQHANGDMNSSNDNSKGRPRSRGPKETEIASAGRVRNVTSAEQKLTKQNVLNSKPVKGAVDVVSSTTVVESRSNSPVKTMSSNTSMADSGITSTGGCVLSSSDAGGPADTDGSDTDIDHFEDETSQEDNDSGTFPTKAKNAGPVSSSKKEAISSSIAAARSQKDAPKQSKQRKTGQAPLPEHRHRHVSEKMERPCSPVTDYEDEDGFLPTKHTWSKQKTSKVDIGTGPSESPSKCKENPYVLAANNMQSDNKATRRKSVINQSAVKIVSGERRKSVLKLKNKKEKSKSSEREMGVSKVLKSVSNPKIVKPSEVMLQRGRDAKEIYVKPGKKKVKPTKKKKEKEATEDKLTINSLKSKKDKVLLKK